MRRFFSLALKRIVPTLALAILCALTIATGTPMGYARGIEPGIRIEASPSPVSPSSWAIFSSPNVGVQNNLAAVAAFSQQDAWAVGSYTQLTAREVEENYPLIEHWNGKVWSVVPEALPKGRQGQLVGVAEITPRDIWAIGNYSNGRTGLFIEHWNGVKWDMIGAPVAGTLKGITAIASNDVWVVGTSTAGDQGLTEHWNGKKWSQVPTPAPLPVDSYAIRSVSLNAVSGLSSSDIWAVGDYSANSLASVLPTLVEHWNGSKWTIVSSPYQGLGGNRVGNQLTSITEIAPNDIWAVGTYSGIHDGNLYILAEHWDGTQWTMMQPPSIYGLLLGVAANATNDVWAVGGTSSTIIEHWDGVKWKQVASPNAGNDQQFEAVTHIPGTHHFWAVGSSGGYPSSTTLILHH